ncbi:hypothetical protein JCM8097_008406 [Rhodosporidiobolus ruineniae]
MATLAVHSPAQAALHGRAGSLSPSTTSTDLDGDSLIEDAQQLPQTLHAAVGTPQPVLDPHAQQLARQLKPSGPICHFGSRLAYTYFPHPAPRQDTLNALTPGRAPGEGAAAQGDEGEQGVLWFTVDDQLQYLSFFQDYGPLNIGCLYRFCLHLHNLSTAPEHAHQKIFLYSSDEPDKKVNAALLMALYAMVVMRWTVADVLHPLSCLELQPYRDAGYSRADYHLHPQSIIYGLSRALSHSLLDLSSFDLAAYELAEKVETGDWNWITPGFVAFASPVEAGYSSSGAPSTARGGKLSRAFRNVLDEFEGKGVKVVVRLNKKLYDPSHFTDRGMEHVEMYFDDGTNPTMEIVREFIDLSERAIGGGGAVAVHCKAGLGRTGTLIGAYLIYKHGFTADEAIGFMRLMRPGSCVGPQQHFLYEHQLEWVRWAAQDQLRAELAAQGRLPSAAAGSTSAAPAEEPGAGTSAAGGARPITPPNEVDLASSRLASPARNASPGTLPPVTPRRNAANVPGQPRKTPGRSRHGVAPPEMVGGGTSPAEKEVGGEVSAAEREEERMEGVVLTSPRKRRSSGLASGGTAEGKEGSGKGKGAMLVDEDGPGAGMGAEDDDDEEEEDELALQPIAASPQKLLGPGAAASSGSSSSLAPAAPISSTRPKTPSGPSPTSTSRPTRIARPAGGPRPLSALADNRIVDRLGNTRASTRSGGAGGASAAAAGGGGGAGTISRSRAAKNLNTVFEATTSASSSAASSAAGGAQTRYPLRNGRTLSAGSSGPAGVPSPADAPASPTKLPQRVLGKRAGAGAGPAGRGGGTAGGKGFDPAAAAAQAGVGVGGGAGKIAGGRNVRRRRSSMGSAEFTQAG